MMLLALALLAAAPVKPLPMLPAPLGHLGNVVDEPMLNGTPGDQKVLTGKLPGCAKDQGLYLTRAISGTMAAVQQLQDWMNKTPGLEKKLFPAGKLGEVVKWVSGSTSSEQKLCEAPALIDGFKLDLTKASGKLCDADHGFRTGDFWWANGGKPAAAVSVMPAPEAAKDACLPRLSMVLFDKAGVARVRLHADYGGVSSITLLGDKCVGLDFNFDLATQVFVPTWRSPKGCKG
jgi:hypothetical protein